MEWTAIYVGSGDETASDNRKRRRIIMPPSPLFTKSLLLLLLCLVTTTTVNGEVIREFEISEGVPVGTSIGFIGEPTPGSSNSPPPPPYLIVPVPGSSVDTDLTIDQSNGEILTKVQLDRETRDSYSLVAIPITGENIRVIIRVKDENDNAPEFPMSSMSVEFPENTPRDVKRTLAPARDRDLGIYNTQRYAISAGNVNNAFRLSSHRERDGVLYLDLQVNGFLDRETIPAYNLLIEAFDGGNPPLKGSMTINITITDQNDNAPVWQFARLPNGDSQYMDDDITFNQSRYFATVAENASVGTSVLQVFALDQDEGPNGQITYSINRRQTDKESVFKIDPVTGVISVNRPLDYESKEVHELVAVARDNGIQPLEATVFVSIRIIDLNDNQLKIKISFFSDDSDDKPPTVSENAQPGEFVARISVHDPDSKQEYENVNMVLEGGEGNFALENRNGVVYLVVASRNLDRETKQNYSFTIIAKDPDNPNVNTSTSFMLEIGDENDSVPKFEQEVWEASVSEVAEPGTSVITVKAVDLDLGNNSALIYSLKGAVAGSAYQKWFEIDPETGLITTRAHLDCETDPMPRLIVTATDKGEPPLSSSSTVNVHLIDSNDTPLFDQSFYNASVMENTPIGRCILKVSASDPDCGINAVVVYSFQETKITASGNIPQPLPFSVNGETGEICVTGVLDFETRHAFEIPVVATDTGGLSSTAIVKVQLEDQNDNVPVFFPAKYNISLKERYVPEGPIISVAAVDRDSGKFGQVSYFIQAGNDKGYFDVDSKSGEIRVTHGLSRENGAYQLLVSAKDGSGQVAEKPAVVTITVVDAQQQPPLFKQARYSFAISEDAPVGSFVGAVSVSSIQGGASGKVRFSISSGDPEQYFSIDSSTGVIKTLNRLDHELHAAVLLNVQAVGETPPTTFSHCQVDIRITDINDNRPHFERQEVSIWVPENAKVGSLIYALHARDKDSGQNGQVVYSWIQGPADIFKLDANSGRITLQKGLDFEETKGYVIAVSAKDRGTPPLSSNNLTIQLEIQDYNDNPPQWQPDFVQFRLRDQRVQAGYQVGRLSSPNKPAGGAIKYALQTMQNVFRIDPDRGILSTAVSLDRGKLAQYTLAAIAYNNNNQQAMQQLQQYKANITVTVHLGDNTGSSNKKLAAAAAGDVDTMWRGYGDTPAKYQVTVSESLTVDSRIVQVIALDEDTGNNARISYTLDESGDTSRMFYMLPHGGTLYLKQMLDREVKDHYEVKVIATDHGSPPLSTMALISITVQDENDHAPQFTQKLYQFTIQENNKPGTVVGEVNAVDEDIGENGAVLYSLQPPHGDFQIDPRSGVIRAISPLDREKQSLYELQVIAVDQGQPQLQSDVIIHVMVSDANDNNPKIIDPTQDALLVREESPMGTEICRVAAVDPDAGENATITYSLARDGYTDGKDFSIDAETGVLRTKTVLNYDKKRFYTLAVIARDKGSPARETRKEFRVEVLDVWDIRASWMHLSSRNKFMFKVAENASVGYLVGSIMVRMDDNSARLTYTILKGNEEGKFEINRASGAILVVDKLDFETANHYVLEVRVNLESDSNSEEATIQLEIDVTDVNDEYPEFSQDPMIVRVSEDHGLGSPVWNFSAVDKDGGLNGIIHYSIREQRPSEKFRVNTLTGGLYLQSPLDFESCSEYVLVVEAVDQSPVISERLSTSVTVHVIVDDENDNAPVFNSVENIVVYKWEPPNTVLHTVMALDKDHGDNGIVSYEISGGNVNNELGLDPVTGQLSLVKPLKRDGVFTLNVTARDNGRPKRKASTQLLTVQVKDVMESPPQFSSRKYEVTVEEGTQVGSQIFQITALPGDTQTGPGQDKLEYLIPEGAAEGKFSIDRHTGTIFVAGVLDREQRSEYTLTVYVHDSSFMSFFDMTTIVIRVTDVNDNQPNFEDTCVDLAVPENSDLGVIHTFTAVDPDVGRNGDVSFTIAGGNVDNVFTVDLHSGRLTCRPLDRERRAFYNLIIVAQDQGIPPQKTQCNLTVTVDDENDSPIVFMASNKSATLLSPYNISEAVFQDASQGQQSSGSSGQASYYASIPEDLPIGTTVLFVEAQDDDIGINSKIRYALNNESHWHFSVDNETGAIVTAGQLDREAIKDYLFEVAATDGGTYDFRSATALVHLRVTDTNDNRPEFKENPVVVQVPGYTKPGQSIMQVVATDADEGVNGQVTYSLSDPSSLFRVQSQSGQVSAQTSLSSEAGKVFHLLVTAKDRGSPMKTSTALVVVKVGEQQTNGLLTFQEVEYFQTLAEDAPTGTSVEKVVALRTDGRRSNILYSLVAGNEDDIFEISPTKGVLRVKNGEKLDRETRATFRLVITATTSQDEGATAGTMNAHTVVSVNLTDVNDSKPRFTQNSYFASVWEGNSKGTFVTQVTATDADLGSNASLIYHIVDGNNDNAFLIDPPFSGIVKTNIVLDREITDEYRLTIIATDEGMPQMTGTCYLHVNVIDIQDQSPVFPPHSVINVSESVPVGTVITTVVANDVDTNPSLVYSFVKKEANPMFFIGKYSGRITLARPLDYEAETVHQVEIQVSDSVHTAKTTLTVNVVDANDHSPVFSEDPYRITISDELKIGTKVAEVVAKDKDSGMNAKIRYSMELPKDSKLRGPCFLRIDEETGTITTNATMGRREENPFFVLILVAQDQGDKPRETRTTLWVEVSSSESSLLRFPQAVQNLEISRDTKPGSVLTQLRADCVKNLCKNLHFHYTLSGGNADGYFTIGTHTGQILLARGLNNQDKTSEYKLRVSVDCMNKAKCMATTEVVIRVTESTRDWIHFPQQVYKVPISESTGAGTTLIQLGNELDGEQYQNESSKSVQFSITSGNEDNLVNVNEHTGALSLKRSLNFDSRKRHRIVVKAEESEARHWALAIVDVEVKDENDHEPFFLFPNYLEFVGENEPVGTEVFTAKATDLDQGMYGRLNYSIFGGDGKDKFRINAGTGTVTTNAVFDYETKKRYTLKVSASDLGGKSCSAEFIVEIESRDEFAPQFVQKVYRFVTPINAGKGYSVGRVEATDRDLGRDGMVRYHLESDGQGAKSPYRVNRTTGVITVRYPLTLNQNDKNVTLTVVASSGREDSRMAEALVEISVGAPSEELEAAYTTSSVADWVLGLLITTLLVLFLCCTIFLVLHLRNKRQNKTEKQAQVFNSASNFGTLEYGAQSTMVLSSGGSGSAGAHPSGGLYHHDHHHHHHQSYGEQYGEVAHGGRAAGRCGVNNTASEISDQSNSASSGRGSAEYGEEVEDEEIRMINEGSLINAQQQKFIPDSGILPDNEMDNVSQNSAKNTQEYLARLGIRPKIPTQDSISNVYGDVGDGGGGPVVVGMGVPGGSGPGGSSSSNADPVDISNLIYAQIADDVTDSELMDEGRNGGATYSTPTTAHNGSLSSIVHNDEELTGSYNWDYLLDWGPQYQPLAHVFSEIACLKDDSMQGSVGGGGGTGRPGIQIPVASSNSDAASSTGHPSEAVSYGRKSGSHLKGKVMAVAGQAGRAGAAGGPSSSVSRAGGAPMHPSSLHHSLLPRSPISHDSTFASGLISPSFSPALSPLANRSPSISPLGGVSSHHPAAVIRTSQYHQNYSSSSDSEFRK